MSASETGTVTDSTVNTILAELGQLGYRATGPRREIVSVVMEQTRPFTAEQIVALLPDIGRATVYRTLEILASIDVVHRLLKAGGFPSYVVGKPGHHHHLVCSNCRRVIEFSECPVDQLVHDLAERTDFRISTHHLEITGLCPACQKSLASN